jgi:transcriptional regulator with XRE-family HTH domain
MSNNLSLKYRFGRKLRSLRRLNELTQFQLAEQVGCSTEYISRIERGLVSPSFDLIEKICLALRIEPKLLFDFSDNFIKE